MPITKYEIDTFNNGASAHELRRWGMLEVLPEPQACAEQPTPEFNDQDTSLLTRNIGQQTVMSALRGVRE